MSAPHHLPAPADSPPKNDPPADLCRTARVSVRNQLLPAPVPDPAAAASDGWDGPRTEADGPAAAADLPTPDEWGRSELDTPFRGDPSDAALPEPGTEFLGFRLEEELGRGAFARVYLARQGDLGGRPVALKVTTEPVGEALTLAQLQHTNIVPVYSHHRAGPLSAVCMPYFGRTTLAHVVEQIGRRPGLPSSGRELRSTVDNRAGSASHLSSLAPDATPPAPAGPPRPLAPPAPVPGGRTPDGWDRLDEMSYVEAVLWLAAQLADGLAHAHARGVQHRDLKPANVLLTDDGRPMLLDFNLADDARLRGPSDRAAAGGTLPYMAPEQLEAFAARSGDRLDGRCDLFSLGAILFELLTGRHPFPVRRGPAREVVARMTADRRQPPPSVRRWNRSVGPAAEAIVHKCLEPDPDRRYQTAEDLREDLARQLAHRPLRHAPNPSARERVRKWARRHPRLSSTATAAVVGVLLVAGLAAGAVTVREQSRGLEARGRFADHRAALADARLFLDDSHLWPRADEGLDRLRAVLARYGVADDPADDGWLDAAAVRYLPPDDRARVKEDVGEAFLLMSQVACLKADGPDRAAWVGRAGGWLAASERYAGDRLPRAILEQRAILAARSGNAAEAARLRAHPAEPGSPRDLGLAGIALARSREYREALPYLRRATQADPQDFSAWFARGTAHLALGQNDLAATCFGACTALRPDFAPAWLNRGIAFARLGRLDAARDDHDRAVRLDPGLTEAYLQRAAVRADLGDLPGAEADLTAVLDAGRAQVRVHFLRADVRDRRGDAAGAKADRVRGLGLTPADELSWIGRGETRLRLGLDPADALADADAALALNPTSVLARQLKAHVLSARLNRPDDALAALDEAVRLNPDYAPARAGRGVLLARRGRRNEALRDAREALLRDTTPPNLYQVAGVYALTSRTNPEDRPEAFRLLWAALRTGYGLNWVEDERADPDLAPVRGDPEFGRLVAAARALRR